MLNELGALLKYEFRFYFRFLPPIYLILIVGTLILRLKFFPSWDPLEMLGSDMRMNISYGEKEVAEAFYILFLLFGWIILIGGVINVITIVQIIQRFINNFMKDQGTLTFTLPVTTWTLLAAKVIAAFCITLISSAAIFASIGILAQGTENIREWIFSLMSQVMVIPIPNAGEIMIIVFIICAAMVQEICRIYIAITVSYFLPRFRFIAGCAVYIALSSFLEQPVYGIAYKDLALDITSYFDSMSGLVFGNDVYTSLLPLGVVSLAFTALYFCATGFLLQRTFNLE